MKQRPVTLAHRVVYVCARAGIALANLLPEPLAYGLAGSLGRLFLRFAPRRRALALATLRRAFPGRPDAELLAIARRATGNLFQVGVDLVRATRWIRRGRLHERIDFGQAPAILAREPGGVLGLTGHLGSWEIAGLAVAALGRETHAIAREFKNPLIQRFLVRSRSAIGLNVHPRRGGIRAVALALRSGKVCLQVVDQNQRLRGVFVPFFGELASTERSAARLALRLRKPIYVGAAVRSGRGFRFRVVLADRIELAPSGDLDADVAAVMTQVNRALERLILAWPEQYLWIHDRYRTRPRAPEPNDPRARA
jgi:KDO2-lipid IV(A) lauroyltransferase